MRIIPQFDLENIQRVIAKDFPNLAMTTIRIIENGWDNVVAEVNGNLIFRFPKDAEADVDLEVKILNFLKDKITLRIPNVEFIGKSFTYMGYRKIPGSDLTREVFEPLSSVEKDNLIFDLANFLREIHSALTPDKARAMGVNNEDLLQYPRLIESVLPQTLHDPSILHFIAATLKEYRVMIQDKVDIVFLYNDLHTDNMAFDPVGKKLNGVFDFGDIEVGDINKEFHPLYKFDPGFMKSVALKYQELTGRMLNLRRVVIHARINELSDLAELIHQPTSLVYNNAIQRIGQWSKEMDIYV